MKIIEMKGSDVNGLKNVFSVFTIDVRMFNTYNFLWRVTIADLDGKVPKGL